MARLSAKRPLAKRPSAKKEIGVYSLVESSKATAEKGAACTAEEEAARTAAWRLYCFNQAEDLYGEKFRELKETALPVFRKHVDQSSPHEAHLSKLRDLVELERTIAAWARTLNFVRYSANSPGQVLPGLCDLWVRELAFRRVQAWHEGQERTINTIIGGRLPSLVVPGRLPDETDSAWRRRIRDAENAFEHEAPRWRRSVRFLHHFEWFVRSRVGRMSLQAIADDWNKRRSSEATTPTTVLRGIRAIDKLVNPPVE